MRRYIFLFFISAVFAVSSSGCAYNLSTRNYNGKSLTQTRINKLNGIMFAYLDIPTAKVSFIAPPRARRNAGRNYYRPSAVAKYNQAVKPVWKLNGNKKGYKRKPIYLINSNPVGLSIKIFSRKSAAVKKTFIINKVNLVVNGIKYDKGYEVVSLTVKNPGQTKTVRENFKYSNAGTSFQLKKYEIIQNLTVANKYKKGITLWLKF